MVKKILVCSPVRGGLSPSYVRATIALLNSTLCRGPDRPYAIDFAWTLGTSVAMARDENADLFLKRGDDELIQWDVDLGVPDPNMMVSMFNRLLSHDVDIVGAAYVGHGFLSQFHGAAHDTRQELLPNGLLKMAQIPLGFSKIKRGVFEKIKQTHPWFQYIFKETAMEKPKEGMFEFFPNGIAGPNTGQGKVERIRALMKEAKEDPVFEWKKDLGEEIEAVMDDSDYSQSIMLGEDFYFCRLAREAGFEMFIDNNLIMPHSTDIRLPVKNEMLLDAIMEEWRWEGNANKNEMRKLVEKLRPNMVKDLP